MLGNYEIIDGKIAYTGNKFTKPVQNVADTAFTQKDTAALFSELTKNKHYKHLHEIDNAVFYATVEYFKTIEATWCNLPLTTKMISSPGEVYAGKKLDYTTDALPVELSWFDTDKIFLAESSQFYLEIRLIIEQLDQVFSIYNSFRKEAADFSHLAEFQHIEYEGKVDFEKNIEIMLGLIRHITAYVLKHNKTELGYYLEEDEINALKTTFYESNVARLTFREALDILAEHTGDIKYKTYSLKNFGSYEEVALTRIVNKHCLVTEFPIEEIPFYHVGGTVDKDGKEYARNADLILLGYREVIGSGQRITDLAAIRKKAEFFNLPAEDYEPYVEMRTLEGYETTSGFGLGWQRYTQWLLKMPYIWDMSHIPRGEHSPRP